MMAKSRGAMMKVYINGKFYEKENAKISVFDHGFLYGDGVFEGIRSYSVSFLSSKSISTGCLNLPKVFALKSP